MNDLFTGAPKSSLIYMVISSPSEFKTTKESVNAKATNSLGGKMVKEEKI